MIFYRYATMGTHCVGVVHVLHYFLKVNYPQQAGGASGARILAPSSLEFALQRLKTLPATPPAIHPARKLMGILANLF
jgi:hypothetical protein